MKINFKHASIFIILLIVEICIALFMHDRIVRPFVGDVLVVGVIYFFIRSFINKLRLLPMYVFLFACFVEVGQYFNLVSILHMENFKAARIIMGSNFDFNDIFCYLIGTIFLFVYEAFCSQKFN